MRRVCSLVAVSVIALGLSAAPARAERVGSPTVDSVTAASAVTALSLVPGTERADVIIAVSGPVQVQDFTVPSPHRIVLDLAGARLSPMGRSYDRVARGGIQNIRLSQYTSDIVRIVLDLDRERAYTVSQEKDGIRVSVSSTDEFAAWHSSGALLAETIAEKREDATTMVEAAGVVDSVVSAIDTPRTDAGEARMVAVSRQQQSQQPRMTVTYSGAEIRDVLAAFASFSSRTIVVGKDVQGTVNAEIKDQPWDVALRAILESHGLAAVEEASGIITVDSYENILKKQASEPVVTQMVNINYVSAASLRETIAGLLYRDCGGGTGAVAGDAAQGAGQNGCVVRGAVAADSGTNSLIITEVASKMPNLLTYVRGLDVRTPQVALKAKIISVQRTNIEQLGLSYDLGSTNTFYNTLLPRIAEDGGGGRVVEAQVELGGDAIAGVANASRKYRTGSALNLIFSTALGKYSLTSFLDALSETQLSDVQAEPSVVTLDNREAKITVGSETPVRVIDAGSAGQIGQPARATVQFRETGIILRVTPHITSNRQIRMRMEAEQSELRIVGGDLGFVIDKRNAQTQLLVGNGETAVIGGLTQTQVTKNRSGIPFLSDLPLIGRFFSQTDSREIKSDLLIMITPTIIDEGDAIRPPGNGR